MIKINLLPRPQKAAKGHLMKTIFAVLMGGIVLALLTNCGRSGSATTGANEMSTVCLAQTNLYGQATSAPCNSNAYTNVVGFGPAQGMMQGGGYSGYGYAVAPNLTYTCGTVNQPTYGFGYGYGNYAGSPGVTVGVYSASLGMGCVAANLIQQNGTPIPYSLESTGKFFVPSSYASSAQVLRACTGSEACAANQVCRSPLGSIPTAIGVCYQK